jgi:hypothetical protein
MIQRDRAGILVPISLTQQDCQDSLAQLILGVNTGLTAKAIRESKELISSKFYRGNQTDANGNTVQDVEKALKGIYGRKCAFCESKRFHPDVEHYRPKKRVTNVKGHHGYYWLCYEWTNLLPSCTDCNKAKLNQFPLMPGGVRVYGPWYRLNNTLDAASMLIDNHPLIDERPYLLHPEWDTPETCLSFTEKGVVYGIDADDRGTETVRICALNRDDLIFFRQKEINQVVETIEMAFCDFDPEYMFVAILNKIRSRALDLDHEYTLLYRNLYSQFCDLIVPILAVPCQHRAEELYYHHVNPI